MPTNAINDTGVKYVYDKLNGKKLEKSTLASEYETETTMTATKAHAANSKFYLAATQQYCMATDDIAIGDTLEENTNYVAITINGFLTDMETYLILAGQMLDSKVDKETGKGLSTNDYTTNDKNKLAGIAAGATKTASSTTNGNIKINDVETQVYDDSEIQDKIDETTTSISGNPISISGLKSNQLAKDPIITLEPIQAGSGTPSPSNIRAISGYDKVEVLSCGKNIAYKRLTNVSIDGSGVVSSFSNYDLILAHVKSGTNYVVSGISDTFKLYGFFITEPTTGSVTYNNSRVAESGSVTGCSFAAPINGWVAFRTANSAVNVQCEEGSSATTYEPPVKTTDLSESLGQTVYGLTHEVRTGKAKVTRKKVIFRWGDGQGTQQLGNYTRRRFLTTDAAMDSSRTNAICDIAPYVTDYTADNNHFYFSTDRSTYIFLPNNTDDNTQIEVCYVLETPTEIQLTPHEISLLSNYAYLSTNGTNIALDYHNGELASLADVSQLGETVNELGDYVGRNEYETTVDLTGYVSSSNIYEFPYDGFVHVSSEAATSGRIRATITAHGTVQNIAYIWMDITQAYQRQSLFVKKGMGLYLQDAVPSGTRVRYVPFM